MKFTALFAALTLLSAPALAVPASDVETRQIVTFDTLTIALTSENDGTFLDRTNYGTKTTPRPAPENGEEWRYAFRSNTDPKAFTWKPVGGKQLQCSFEVKADAGTAFISLDLEKNFLKGLKKNVGGYPIETNCFIL